MPSKSSLIADDVSLSERVLDAVVLVVEADRGLGRAQTIAPELLLARRRADADRNAVDAAADAAELADEHGHEIRRHPLRRGEADGAAAAAQLRLRDDGAVGDGG